MNSRGKFITLEGGEGSGKSTAIQRIADYLDSRSIPYIVTREPGGIEIAEKIRDIILDPKHTAMDARTEALLYAASRRQHLAEKVRPAIEQGILVLCDRFVDSSLVYQGYARGLGLENVWSINKFAIGDLLPDLTFYLDIAPEIGLKRIATSDDHEVNRLDLENLSFHYKVREGYKIIADMYADRIFVVDASRSQEEVAEEMIRQLEVRILKDF
ncbi:dTMP kinase [Paenibacillus sediminis]|uniref:Thymidylate kinase n=1 Tax=Paenibacillus sediminis TaxID=664909 RepID=A0ABS4H797_9BACL|nr:dTMP kinase [Paenibacillus sediminis]MBP1938418.1 dTMP kinase [Paenibacillus sediminis]